MFIRFNINFFVIQVIPYYLSQSSYIDVNLSPEEKAYERDESLGKVVI